MEDKEPYNEQELLQKIANGDEIAYRCLYETYWPSVYGLALRLTKSPEQAKDLTQEVFLRVWAQRAQLSRVRNFASFVYTINRNLVHDYLRNKIFKESNKEFLELYLQYEEAGPDRLLEIKEAGVLLQQAINSLSPKLQQVFTLGRLKGLKHEEIAAHLKITPMSSKAYMVRALIGIRKFLEKDIYRPIVIFIYLSLL